MIGVLWGLVCALAWSAANYNIKPAAASHGDLGALFQAQIAGGLAIIPAALWLEGVPSFSLEPRGQLALGIAGLSAVIAYVGLFAALRRGRLALVAPLISGWTVLSVLIGVLWMGESMGASQWVGVGLVILGNALLARVGGEGDPGEARSGLGGVGWALLSALGFGVMVPAVDVLGADLGRLWAVPAVWSLELVLGVSLWALLGLAGLNLKVFGRQSLATDLKGAVQVGRVGVLEVLGFVGMSVGVGAAPVAIVAPVASLSTGFSVLWGTWLRGERLTRLALIGAITASVGVVMASVPL